MPPVPPSDGPIKERIVRYLQRVPFDRAIEQPDFRELLAEDAKTSEPLFRPDARDAFEEARQLRRQRRSDPMPGAFFSNKSVLLVPGFLGSQLRDEGPARNGLIWLDPKVYATPSQLSALKLAPLVPSTPNASDRDAGAGVVINEDGAVPIVYAGLRYYLETGRCEVRTAGFDWRKNADESAARLAHTIQSFAAEAPRRPFFLVAHSQGSLVARRALQLLGKENARRLVNRLVLLGPASYGTFSAAFAIAGSHDLIRTLASYGLRWPPDLADVLQSMSGLYQLLPWKTGTAQMDLRALGAPAFWETGADANRLNRFFGWAASIDTEFFNDRISIILGDDPQTPSAVEFRAGKLVPTKFARGDGTVTDACAILDGVGDVARAAGADHMALPLNRQVMQAVWRIINANLTVQALAGFVPSANGAERAEVAALPPPMDLFALAGVRRKKAAEIPEPAVIGEQEVPEPVRHALALATAPPPAPPVRRLKVFSFDPLLASDPESMGMESVTLELKWDDESADGAKLQPGPVGEYLEVVDYDPASRCFYPPVDLNHPNLLAQDGMPLSETNPQFHQQMVYAVGMATVAIFERALGRSVLWAPHLPRDASGRVVRDPDRPDGEFVRRLRVYPHALREANAYYDPRRKALLFGYFPARAKVSGKVLPRGTVFTCLSYDVIAHEITHALLDGMRRQLLDPSNPDVFAFHEAFADIVALLQHFSHPEVLRRQVARVAGELQDESMLGQLAQQFGEAMGMHGSLRGYLGKKDENGVWKPIKPDPNLYETVTEPHDRGSILVAAMFTAFLTIYRNRTRDLMRIATGGSGVKPPGELHPDLVNRLAGEAAKAASHLLLMAIRALDYIPPVDLTFGDYLRALVTSDADLIPDDARFYRVAVVDAFRQWGIYPTHVRTLSVDGLIWGAPEGATAKLDMTLFRNLLEIAHGNLKLDRAALYQHQRRVQAEVHDWMREQFDRDPSLAREWGLDVSPDAPRTIARDRRAGKGEALPKFDVQSIRRCRRTGPDSQERVELIIEVVQRRNGYLSEDEQGAADARAVSSKPDFIFRGGATLIVDPRAGRIRYVIRKAISSKPRLAAVRAFRAAHGGALGLRGNYFSDNDNPFVHLHAEEDD